MNTGLINNAILCTVINWNGWRDTIICLESLFALTKQPDYIAICDNNSSDHSFENILKWLAKNYKTSPHPNTATLDETQVTTLYGDFSPKIKSIYILRFKKNFGYAGAINRCMNWAKNSLFVYNFWLLNNDVKVHPDALDSLTLVIRSSPDIGLCGSVLLDWDRPENVQAIGGIFNRWIGTAQHLKHLPKSAAIKNSIFFEVDYPIGASLFVTKEYLETVGTMDEEYFLYYEEIDWVERGKRHGFRPAVALRSLVQHKEGASTGSHGSVRNKSILSERYGVINRLRITRKFWPWYLPVVWMSLWLVLLDRAVHGEWARARLVLKLMFEPRP